MKLDPLSSLAFAIHQSPGVYALLLGSGTSKSAGVPTGWDIVLDLLGHLAALHDESPEPDPVAWYRTKFQEEPAYDVIIREVAKKPSARRDLLRGYFEQKVPQAAHRAIAWLVDKGYIRLILTTNFDTLIESALQDKGIEPDEIRSDHDLRGAQPLIHSKRTVVKLHGDYRDDRIKNTEDELTHYSSPLNKFLDRVLDEFGLAVCGWSADWDIALREAILRAPSRRYQTYWVAYGEPTEAAQEIVRRRDAVVIPIEDADTFFSQLADKVEALESLDQPHPLSVEMAVAQTKKHLLDPVQRVQFEELLDAEVERVATFRNSIDTADRAAAHRPVETVRSAFSQARAASGILCAIGTTIGWYGMGEHSAIVTRSVERLAEVHPREGFVASPLVEARLQPALMFVYALGVADIASRRPSYLSALLSAPVVYSVGGSEQPAISVVNHQNAFANAWRFVHFSQHSRGSSYLFDTMRPLLQRYLPSDEEYQRAFNVFEFLVGLVYMAVTPGASTAPVGAFIFRYEAMEPVKQMICSVAREGSNSPIIAGLFSGDPDRFRVQLERYLTAIKRFASQVSTSFEDWPNLLELYDSIRQPRS